MKITDDMLTEWFPATISPMHEGEYQARSTDNTFGQPIVFRVRWFAQKYCVYWGASGEWRSDACRINSVPDEYEWRGLKEPQRD